MGRRADAIRPPNAKGAQQLQLLETCSAILAAAAQGPAACGTDRCKEKNKWRHIGGLGCGGEQREGTGRVVRNRVSQHHAQLLDERTLDSGLRKNCVGPHQRSRRQQQATAAHTTIVALESRPRALYFVGRGKLSVKLRKRGESIEAASRVVDIFRKKPSPFMRTNHMASGVARSQWIVVVRLPCSKLPRFFSEKAVNYLS